MEHAQEIINQVIDDPNDFDIGVLANEHLREFHRGYPLELPRLLLLSPNGSIAETGIWVASELGQKAKPLLGDMVHLLKHSTKTVRFFAVDYCPLLENLSPLTDRIMEQKRKKSRCGSTILADSLKDCFRTNSKQDSKPLCKQRQ